MRTVFDKHKLAWKHFWPEGNGKAKSGYDLHHIDQSLRKDNPERYAEWRPEDLIMVTHAEHRKYHIPWNKGKTGVYSEETRQKISDSLKGKPCPWNRRKYTDEQRKAKSEQMRKWYENYKATHTDEDMERMHHHGGIGLCG